jgi:hypothetical protein
MSGLSGMPKDTIINAIWRCKRGHERPAAYQSPTAKVDSLIDFAVTMEDGQHAVCLICLVEDYSMTRVDFKAET